MTQLLEAARRAGAAVTFVPMTLQQIRRVAASAFDNRANERFDALDRIEHQPDRENQPVKGTILEPIVNALNDAGVPTEPTVGGVMKSLQVDFDVLHERTCNCMHDEKITGVQARANFMFLAELAA